MQEKLFPERCTDPTKDPFVTVRLLVQTKDGIFNILENNYPLLTSRMLILGEWEYCSTYLALNPIEIAKDYAEIQNIACSRVRTKFFNDLPRFKFKEDLFLSNEAIFKLEKIYDSLKVNKFYKAILDLKPKNFKFMAINFNQYKLGVTLGCPDLNKAEIERFCMLSTKLNNLLSAAVHEFGNRFLCYLNNKPAEEKLLANVTPIFEEIIKYTHDYTIKLEHTPIKGFTGRILFNTMTSIGESPWVVRSSSEVLRLTSCFDTDKQYDCYSVDSSAL
jgi:hypothetical protein